MVEPSGTNRHSTQMHLQDDTSQCVPSSPTETISTIKLQTTCQRHEPGKTTLIYIQCATPVNV